MKAFVSVMGWKRSRRPRAAGAGLAGGLALLAAAFLAAPAMAGDDAAATGDFEWSWKIPAGQTIEILGVNGAIVAKPAEGAETEVRAVKTAKRSDPDEVQIEVIRHDGGVTVCAHYPGKGNRCEPGGGGQMRLSHNDVKVDFFVSVAKGVHLVGHTVNGRITADDLDGPVEASTVNGSVDVTTRGTARATTVNGSIAARVGVERWPGTLEFTTVNGGITLSFPPGLSARLKASTVNGDISTDFPLRVMGKISRRSIRGSVGDDKAAGDLSLSTVNGSIRLQSSI